MIELHGRIDPVKNLQGTMKAVAGDVYDVPPVYIQPKLQAKTAKPTGENQRIAPDDGYDGLSSVAIEAVALQAKSVTPTAEESYVQPDNGYVGLSIVEVKGDSNLVPENIASGVSIFGVTGEHVGGGLRSTAISFVKDGDTITETSTLEDGSTATSIMQLDENGYPSSITAGDNSFEIGLSFDESGNLTTITIDGEDCPVSWEGF